MISILLAGLLQTGVEASPRTLTGHTGSVMSVAFSPDGKLLASGSRDDTVRLWDVGNAKLLRTLSEHKGDVYTVAFTSDGKTLITGAADKAIFVWSIREGKLLRTLAGHEDVVRSVSLSPDGRTLASAGLDKVISLWDFASGKQRQALPGHTQQVRSVEFSADGERLASAGPDRIIRIWEPRTGKLLKTLEGHTSSIEVIAWSPDSKTLASGSNDTTVRLWDPAAGKLVRTLTGHKGEVDSVAFSPDGRILASGNKDTTIRLWDPTTGAVRHILSGHVTRVESLAFSPDGKTLASGGGGPDSSIKLWDLSFMKASTAKPAVIDAHMHVWSGDSVRFPFAHPYDLKFKPPKIPATVELLLQEMDQADISHCVLVQTISHGWDNRYLVECLKAHPKRFKGQGLIDPTDPDVAKKLEYWMREHGLAGMRFSPMYYKGKDDWLNAKSSDALWNKAEELGAVFNFFIASEQLPKLDDMIGRHPKVKVVIDHLARVDLEAKDPEPEIRKLLALARHPNVWVKVSEFNVLSPSKKYPYKDVYPLVKRVYDAFGPDRLLWGTGFPGATRGQAGRPTLQEELAIIRTEIPFFTADDREKILGRNTAKVWGFEVR